MAKATFKRVKPHVNIALIGCGGLMIGLFIFAALGLVRARLAPIPNPTATATAEQITAFTSTTPATPHNPLTLSDIQGNWVIYQDMCGGAIPALQANFTIRNDSTEPVPVPDDNLILTHFGPDDPASENEAPQYLEMFIVPNLLTSAPQNTPASLLPGDEIQVFLEFIPSHPDFMWVPTYNPVPTADAAASHTLYGRYHYGNDPASSSSAPVISVIVIPQRDTINPAPNSENQTDGQLFGDIYTIITTQEDREASGNILWGDYQYLDTSRSSSDSEINGFQDTYIGVMFLPDIPGLFKETADGETAHISNLVLKRGITAGELPANTDTGNFWFFDLHSGVDMSESEMGAIYQFNLEGDSADKPFPVIIGQLPNSKGESKRPPMVLMQWGRSFPRQINQSDLAFLHKISQLAGWANVSGLSNEIDIVEFTHPTPCPTPTNENIDSSSQVPTETTRPQVQPATPTNTLQPSRAPEKPTETEIPQRKTPEPTREPTKKPTDDRG
jgi:hypothetical protein